MYEIPAKGTACFACPDKTLLSYGIITCFPEVMSFIRFVHWYDFSKEYHPRVLYHLNLDLARKIGMFELFFFICYNLPRRILMNDFIFSLNSTVPIIFYDLSRMVSEGKGMV